MIVRSIPGRSQAGCTLQDRNGFGYLAQIVPADSGKGWFVVEDNTSFPFLLCEETVKAIQAIIGEYPPFEYYIVSPDLNWLVKKIITIPFLLLKKRVRVISPKLSLCEPCTDSFTIDS